jgi:16S rRNA processing protein RimM
VLDDPLVEALVPAAEQRDRGLGGELVDVGVVEDPAARRERDDPPLPEGEYWAEDLSGCAVVDGDRVIGSVVRMLPLPSCEVLEVRREDGGELLVPMVRDAIRSIDVGAHRVDIDLSFIEGEGT